MIFEQIFTKEEKDNLEQRLQKVYKLRRNISYGVSLVLILLLAYIFLSYIVSVLGRNPRSILLSMIVITEIIFLLAQENKSRKRMKYITYTAFMDGDKTDNQQYDIKAGRYSIAVNGSVIVNWRDIHTAFYATNHIILAGKGKSAVIFKADKELKDILYEYLQKNKTDIVNIGTNVNKPYQKDNLKRYRKKILPLVILWILLAVYAFAFLPKEKPVPEPAPQKTYVYDSSKNFAVQVYDVRKETDQLWPALDMYFQYAMENYNTISRTAFWGGDDHMDREVYFFDKGNLDFRLKYTDLQKITYITEDKTVLIETNKYPVTNDTDTKSNDAYFKDLTEFTYIGEKYKNSYTSFMQENYRNFVYSNADNIPMPGTAKREEWEKSTDKVKFAFNENTIICLETMHTGEENGYCITFSNTSLEDIDNTRQIVNRQINKGENLDFSQLAEEIDKYNMELN